VLQGREVKRRIHDLARAGGHLRSVPTIFQADVPTGEYRGMFDAAMEFRRYRSECSSVLRANFEIALILRMVAKGFLRRVIPL